MGTKKPATKTPGATPPANPLGPLALLKGKWVGKGFNEVWRPLRKDGTIEHDRFLELNFTQETLEFTEIDGPITNRGLRQADIELFGLTYVQRISDANVKGATGKPNSLHLETGMWLNVPATTEPAEPGTVARLANIPHGNSLVAQGTASSFAHAPQIPDTNIIPFFSGDPGDPLGPFEVDLAKKLSNRTPLADVPGLTQAILSNPNAVLQADLAGLTVTATTMLQVSTVIKKTQKPSSGGGVSNIAFLEGAPDGVLAFEGLKFRTSGANAKIVEVESTFWIETTKDSRGKIGHVLQYTQLVLMDFHGISWPHVSVATLIKK